MHKNMDVGRRILGLLLAVCLIIGAIPPVQLYAEGELRYEVRLWKDSSKKSLVGDNTYTYNSESFTPYVEVLDKENGSLPLPESAYTYSFSKNKDAGDATVTVTSIGTEHKFGLTTTFKINKAKIDNLKFTYDQTEDGVPYGYYTGGAVKPGIREVRGERMDGRTDILTEGTDYEVTYQHEINACEDEYANDAPRFTINLIGNYEYGPDTSAKTVRYRIYYNMATAVSISNILSQTFTGSAITPNFSVKNTSTSENVDYVEKWENNTNVGTAKLTLVGTGKYMGEAVRSFEIKAADIGEEANVDVQLNASYYPYTGSRIPMEDNITVTLVNGGVNEYVVPRGNYDIDYKTNGILGENTLILKGKNNLTGERTVVYMVKNNIVSYEIKNAKLVYDGTGKIPTIIVKDGRGNVISDEYYTVTYYEPSGEVHYAKRIDDPNGPSAVGTYYIKIEGNDDYVTGDFGTEDDPVPLSFEIVAKQIGSEGFAFKLNNSFAGSDPFTTTYTGKNQKPTLTVMDGENELELGKDYEVEFVDKGGNTTGDWVDAGTYSIRITGKGSYGGTYELKYIINPVQLEADEVEVEILPQTYTGQKITPDSIKIIVKNGGTSIEITDYEIISSTNDIDININSDRTAVIVIQLTGNYRGTVKGEFKIKPRSIEANYCEDAPIENVVYNGSAQVPSIKISDTGLGTILESGRDYRVVYYDEKFQTALSPVNAGTYGIIITGEGNYTGELKKTFTINQKSFESDDITAKSTNPEYNNGEPVKDPVITVKDGTRDLREGTDYEFVGYFSDEGCTQEVKEPRSGKIFVKLQGIENYKDYTYTYFYIGNDIGALAKEIKVERTLTYNRHSQYNTILQNLYVYDVTGGTIKQQDANLNNNYTVHFYSDNTYTTELKEDDSRFVNWGTIYIEIEGTGRYYGTKRGSCAIDRKKISDTDILGNVIGIYTYNGEAQTPEINDGRDTQITDGVFLKFKDAGDGGDYTLNASEYQITYRNNVNAGTAEIRLAGTDNYTGERWLTFHIGEMDINDLVSLKVNIPSRTYTSQYLQPSVTVTYGPNQASLVAGRDFTVSYWKESSFQTSAGTTDMTNVGSTWVKITGMGNYTGDVKSETVGNMIEYKIEPRNLSEVSVTIEGSSFVWSQIDTESKIPRLFEVRYYYAVNGYYVLQSGKDYMLSKPYMDYEIGPQSLSITAEGITGKNFTGSKEVKFNFVGNMDNSAGEIEVEGIEDKVYQSAFGTNGATCNITVYYNKNDGDGKVVDSNAYTVTYTNNKNVGLATVKITGKESAYWTGTYTKTFKITSSVTEAVVTLPDQMYTGEPYTADTIQNMQVTCHGYTLRRDVDYTIESIENNTNAALSTGANAPTITIKGKGDYFPSPTDTQRVKFSIKYDINSANLEITEIPDQIYTEEAIEPTITLAYKKADDSKDNTLTEGKDYTVTYSSNVEVGSGNGKKGPYALITATSDGLFLTGSRVVPFTILPVNLEGDRGYRITGVAPIYYYTGSAIRPEIAVVDRYGNELNPNNYSTVCESTSWQAGTTVTVKAVGKGNYYGTITTTFYIEKRSLAREDNQVDAVIADVTYNGKEQKPTFRVTFEDYNGNTQTLRLDDDYEIVDYINNTNAGTGNEYQYNSGPYVWIRAISGKSVTGERMIPFNILPRDMKVLNYSKIVNPTYETGKSVYKPEVTVKIEAGSDKPLTDGIDYTAVYHNNTQAATANGTVGPYIEFQAASQNFTGSYEMPFSILKKSIAGEEFQVTLRDTTGALFDEKKWNYPEPGTYMPEVTLTDCTDPENPMDLIAPTDYQLEYANNDRVGAATITITGSGNYTDVRTVRFTIGTLFDETNIAVYQGNSLVKDSFASVTYNGRPQRPQDITVRRIAPPAADLVIDTHYSISYYMDANCTRQVLADSMINAGTYYVCISGLTTAGYIGDIVIPFTINQKSINSPDVSVDAIPSQEFGSGNVRPAVTVRDSSTGLVIPNTSYDVTYRNNNAIGTATAVITGNTNGNYTGSRNEPFSIVRQDISDKIVNGKAVSVVTVYPIPDHDYTGSAILPDPEVFFGETRLVKGRDYRVQPDPNYGDNIKAGTAWIVIQGIGNYAGTKAVTFKIKANLEKASVSAVKNQTYTGKPVEPKVRVICGGNELTEGKQYQITYSEDHTNPGDAYMIITPTNAYKEWYTGSYLLRYTICDNIENANITVPSSQTYTGSQITPDLTVKIGNTVLKKNTDYTVQWSNNIGVGTATATVSGIGKYAGSQKATYKIIAKNIARCTVNSIADVVYDKKAHAPNVVIRDGSKVLALGSDYEIVSRTNNKNIGTATINVRGIGNYTGTRKITFSIISAPITGLKSGSVTMTSVKLSWSKKSNITGYEVYTNNVKTKVAQTQSNSITIKKLKAGTTYKYKVRTYTVINKKTYYGAFKTITISTKPKAPSITVKSTAKKQAKISWKRISGATGYEIYRSTSKNGKYAKVALILKGTTVSYTNKKLTSKKRYYYKVKAYRTVNGTNVYSGYSSVKSVVVK